MSLLEHKSKFLRSGLLFLFKESEGLEYHDEGCTLSYIDAGEYSLALDDIAYIYIKNSKLMSKESFSMFEAMVLLEKTEEDSEYENAIQLCRSMRKNDS